MRERFVAILFLAWQAALCAGAGTDATPADTAASARVSVPPGVAPLPDTSDLTSLMAQANQLLSEAQSLRSLASLLSRAAEDLQTEAKSLSAKARTSEVALVSHARMLGSGLADSTGSTPEPGFSRERELVDSMRIYADSLSRTANKMRSRIRELSRDADDREQQALRTQRLVRRIDEQRGRLRSRHRGLN